MKKIALIGVGKMGLSHLAIANQTPGIEVVAICDTSKPLLRVLEKNTTFQGFSDYRKMISKTELDGIMILVPTSFHFEIATYCIQKGINIFIEKPLTLSKANSQFLVESARNHNVKGQVGYVNRFNPIFEHLKEMLDKNVIGEVSNYVNRMTGGVILKKSNKGWRNDYTKGGGCLFDYGSHCFDLSTYLFGTNVHVKSAKLKRVFSSAVDDIVYSTLVHDEKIVGSNYVNWSDSSMRKANNSIEISGSKGKILANKQELSIYLSEENVDLNLKSGWNQLYITDRNTDVNYYLRGEDYSRQLTEFSNLLNGIVNESRSSLFNASVIDMLLEETKELAGGLL